jgi:hypothetical protein
MSPFLGGPVTITGLWLIPEFPTKPPPEYVRSGYASLQLKHIINEFALTIHRMELEYEGGISLVKKPMDPETGDKLQSFMQPMHVALAIWDAYNEPGRPSGRCTVAGREVYTIKPRKTESHGHPWTFSTAAARSYGEHPIQRRARTPPIIFHIYTAAAAPTGSQPWI